MRKKKTRSVLVADDDPEIRDIMRLTLEMMDFDELVIVSDGEDAYHQLFLHDFDLVISDWMMPLMSGLELLDRMKKDKRFKKIPFMMVTSEAMVENIDMAVNAGVDDYIVKPFSPSLIMDRVSLLLA
jgi:CheY-like chemotaxis protein